MSRSRWGIAAAALLVAGAVPPVRPQTDPPSEPLGERWSRPAGRVISLAVSPEGDVVLSADLKDTVRCLNGADGMVRWEHVIAGADSVATSRGGRLSLAYAARQPLHREVTFIDRDGRRFYALKPSAPVAFAAVAPSGRYAAVASGRSVIFCHVAQGAVRYRVIRLSGEPRQVQFGPGDSFYVATRNPDEVLLIKGTGRVLWRHTERSGADYSISASEDGRLLAIGCERPGNTVVAALVDSSNQTRWRINTAGRAPRIRLSSAGAALTLSYEHLVTHNSLARFERRLTYLTANQDTSWTKGGAFSTPIDVAIAPDGAWVVTLDTRQTPDHRFYIFPRSGVKRYHYPSPAHILIAVSSLDGRHIAAYREDSMVTMLQVGEP